MKPTISIALITLGLTFPAPVVASEWKQVPGSYLSLSGSDCHVEINTRTIARLNHRVMWEERMSCTGGHVPGKKSVFGGYANCSSNGEGVLLANDGFSAEWVQFSKAQLTPHHWGMGNLGYRVACDLTR